MQLIMACPLGISQSLESQSRLYSAIRNRLTTQSKPDLLYIPARVLYTSQSIIYQPEYYIPARVLYTSQSIIYQPEYYIPARVLYTSQSIIYRPEYYIPARVLYTRVLYTSHSPLCPTLMREDDCVHSCLTARPFPRSHSNCPNSLPKAYL